MHHELVDRGRVEPAQSAAPASAGGPDASRRGRSPRRGGDGCRAVDGRRAPRGSRGTWRPTSPWVRKRGGLEGPEDQQWYAVQRFGDAEPMARGRHRGMDHSRRASPAHPVFPRGMGRAVALRASRGPGRPRVVALLRPMSTGLTARREARGPGRPFTPAKRPRCVRGRPDAAGERRRQGRDAGARRNGRRALVPPPARRHAAAGHGTTVAAVAS